MGFTIAALNTVLPIRLDGDHAGLLGDELPGRWRRCLVEPASGSVAAEELTLELRDLDQLKPRLQGITQEITHRLIEAQAGRLLLCHAGAVAHPRTGASLVYIAPGGTGKTTLSKTLGRRYGYLTDETVGISRSGRIHAYPKPLSVRTTNGEPKDELSPDALGLVEAHPQPWVTQIVLLDRRDDAVDVTVEELSTLDALAAIGPETSSLAKLPSPLRWLADLIHATGPVQRWRYREAADLLPLAIDILDEAQLAPEPTEAQDETAAPVQDAIPDPAGGVRLGELVDLMIQGGQCVVLQPGRILRVGPLGTAIITACRTPTSLDELSALLSERFGEPEDGSARQATETAVRDLAAEGVLVLDE